MKIETDVLIIGGGVAGLLLAKHLQEEGIKSLLLEKNPVIGKYGNRIINKEVFKSLGLKNEDIIHKINKINFFSPSEIKLSKSGPTRGYVVNLKNIETHIFENLNKDRVFIGTQVTGVDFRKNQVKCKKVNFASKLIITATGCKENIIKGDTKPCFCYTNEIIGKDVSTVVLDNRYTHGFYGWIIPLSENNIEIGFGTDRINQTTISSVKKMLKSLPYIKRYRKNEVRREMGGFIPTSIIEKRCGKSNIIIGDCSGGEPMLGGSIHKCIDEAKMAKNAIINNLTDGTPLQRYESNFKKTIGNDIKKQQTLRDALNDAKNQDIDKVFKMLQGKKMGGGGLVNELFKNIIKHLPGNV